MTDRISLAVVTTQDMRCSNCVHGHQLVAGVGGGSVDKKGKQTRWHLVKPIEIGFTRNCLNWWQRSVLEIPKFIYPKESDACINPKKFKSK
ncbi:MAG: hypothetical protein ACD_19C00182G0017 [uncultured bacterium]|nr:MAG: hypothetical protein ACD_19C00182G0017 [uncultured bacterium]